MHIAINILIKLVFNIFFYRLWQEINENIGSKVMIENEDLPKLEYTSWIFKETLRLWPLVPSINRLLNEDLIINGYFVPKNTEISVIY